jgi:hypothetical protein
MIRCARLRGQRRKRGAPQCGGAERSKGKEEKGGFKNCYEFELLFPPFLFFLLAQDRDYLYENS